MLFYTYINIYSILFPFYFTIYLFGMQKIMIFRNDIYRKKYIMNEDNNIIQIRSIALYCSSSQVFFLYLSNEDVWLLLSTIYFFVF